jgi:hypothetical protein
MKDVWKEILQTVGVKNLLLALSCCVFIISLSALIFMLLS